MASGSGPCGLSRKKRSRVSTIWATSSRGISPRSTRNGAVASAIPTAAMLAGDPFEVLSATSPFSRLTWWM